MVYLPGALNRTRSNNAQNLYQDQSNMGVTQPPSPGGGVPSGPQGGMTPAAPQPAPTGGGGQPPSRLTEYMQAQQNQRDMLAARGQDLQLAQAFVKILDPSLPKGFRQLGLKQISQQLGIDPRGDKAKELINTIAGLDPQSMEGMRRGIAAAADEAQPGEITSVTRGILTGQVPPDQLMTLAQGASAASAGGPAPTDASSGGGADESPPMMLGGPSPGASPALTAPSMVDQGTDVGPAPAAQPTQLQFGAPAASGQPNLPGASAAPRTTGPSSIPAGAAPPADVPLTNQAHTPYPMREVIPELTTPLGLDYTQRYRLQDLYRAGYNRIPSDPVDQRKLAADINTSQQGVVDTMAMASQLAGLVRGRPEALDASFHVPSLGDIGGNPSSAASKVGAFIEGIARTFGVSFREGEDVDFLNKFVKDALADPKNTAFGTYMTARIVDWARQQGAQIEDVAELNARINSVMVPLAFAMAAAKGQTGRFLSDKDVEFQLRELGKSNNPAQFIAAITDMVGRINQQYDTKMRTHVGQPVPLDSAISPEVANMIRVGGVAPANVLAAVGATPADVTQAPSTGGRLTSNQGQSLTAAGIRPGEPLNRPPNAAAGIQAQPSAPDTGGGGPAPPSTPYDPNSRRRVLPLSSPTIASEEAQSVQRAQEDRAAALETRDQNRRRLQLAESAESRAARNELEQRRLHIQQAFANIGKALSGAIQGGGGGVISGGGSDQDPNAFRISPLPQRRAPQPAPAINPFPSRRR